MAIHDNRSTRHGRGTAMADGIRLLMHLRIGHGTQKRRHGAVSNLPVEYLVEQVEHRPEPACMVQRLQAPQRSPDNDREMRMQVRPLCSAHTPVRTQRTVQRTASSKRGMPPSLHCLTCWCHDHRRGSAAGVAAACPPGASARLRAAPGGARGQNLRHNSCVRLRSQSNGRVC